jgi:hypothetical protein
MFGWLLDGVEGVKQYFCGGEDGDEYAGLLPVGVSVGFLIKSGGSLSQQCHLS